MTRIHRGLLAVFAALVLTTGLTAAVVRLGEPVSSTQQNAQPRPARRTAQTRIVGLVVDETGRPVAGAVIRTGPAQEGAPSATAGADGTFTLILDRPALRRHVLFATANDGASQGLVKLSESLTQPETTARIVLKLAKLVTVRVIDTQGRGVPGASVVVLTEMDSALPQALVAPVPLPPSQTDVQGIARLRIPADARVPDVVALKGGLGLDYYEAERVVASLGRKEVLPLPEAITLVLAGARPVRFRAVDRESNPVSDVAFTPLRIRLRGKHDILRFSLAPVFRVKSDAAGIATLDYLPPSFEEFAYQIVSEHLAQETFPGSSLSSTQFERETVVRLVRKVPVLGHVFWSDGKPAPDVLVQIDGRSSWGRGVSSDTTRTGADGMFRFEVKPDMFLMIAVVDDEWAALTRAGMITRPGGPVENELGLIKGTVIRGRVTAGPEHTPVAEQSVTLVELGPPLITIDAAGKTVAHPGALQLNRRTVTDSDGRYEFRVGPGEYRLALVPLLRPVGPFKIGNEPEIVRDFEIDRPPVLRARSPNARQLGQ